MAPLLCMEVMLTMGSRLHAIAQKLYSAGHGSTAMHGGHANHGQQTACHGGKTQYSAGHGSTVMHGEMAVTAATTMRVTTRTVEGTRGRAAEDISCNNQVLWDNFLPCDSRSTSSSFNTFIPWFIPRIQRPIQDMTKPSQVSSHFILVVCHLNHLVKVIISSHSSNLKDVDYPQLVP
ncbi:putative WRKY transcription factor 53-like [Capsicum annuum]|nr:putative WRKY transcription factor 53-like [Capsicum annuum]